MNACSVSTRHSGSIRATPFALKSVRYTLEPLRQTRHCACLGCGRLVRGRRRGLELLAIVRRHRIGGKAGPGARLAPVPRRAVRKRRAETPRTSAQSLDYLKRRMFGDEVRTPPSPCPPVVRLNPDNLRTLPCRGCGPSGSDTQASIWRSTGLASWSIRCCRLCVAVSAYRAEALPCSAAGARSAAENGRRGHLARSLRSSGHGNDQASCTSSVASPRFTRRRRASRKMGCAQFAIRGIRLVAVGRHTPS